MSDKPTNKNNLRRSKRNRKRNLSQLHETDVEKSPIQKSKTSNNSQTISSKRHSIRRRLNSNNSNKPKYKGS